MTSTVEVRVLVQDRCSRRPRRQSTGAVTRRVRSRTLSPSTRSNALSRPPMRLLRPPANTTPATSFLTGSRSTFMIRARASRGLEGERIGTRPIPVKLTHELSKRQLDDAAFVLSKSWRGIGMKGHKTKTDERLPTLPYGRRGGRSPRLRRMGRRSGRRRDDFHHPRRNVPGSHLVPRRPTTDVQQRPGFVHLLFLHGLAQDPRRRRNGSAGGRPADAPTPTRVARVSIS